MTAGIAEIINEYVFVFLSGVAVSFTPCVYPLVPITASFIAGIDEKGGRFTGFILSAVYVLGIAITYCAFGILAALTGKVFGQVQNTFWGQFFFSAVLAVLGLILVDVIRIPQLGIVVSRYIRPRNIGTILLFGMASGLAVGPCTAPVLGSILVYVGAKQNLWHGGSLLFVFSYGVGASLILVGTFSGLLVSLPKAGAWMVRVKHICGVVLLVSAAYFFFTKVVGVVW